MLLGYIILRAFLSILKSSLILVLGPVALYYFSTAVVLLSTELLLDLVVDTTGSLSDSRHYQPVNKG